MSYSRGDRPRVEPLVACLQRLKLAVWWDPGIEPGADFAQGIHRELEQARFVVVVWSAASVASGWVRDEANEGQRLRKLIPVRIDPTDPPLGFRSLQTVDLSDWNGDAAHPELARLLARLSRQADAGPVGGDAPQPQTTPQARQPAPARRSGHVLRYAAAAAALAAVGAVTLAIVRPASLPAWLPNRVTAWLSPAADGAGGTAARDLARQEADLRQRLVILASNRSPPAPPYTRDMLARRYEGYSPDHVGSDFRGNRYYGIYRIHGGTTLPAFLGFLRQFYPDLAQPLDAAGGAAAGAEGRPAFEAAWRLAAAQPSSAEAQTAFVERSNYRAMAARLAAPAAAGLRGGLGIELGKRSIALQAVIFSIAVQHGPASRLPLDALAPLGNPARVDDRTMIEALYKARDQVERYFPEVLQPQYIELLKRRNQWEHDDALHMLDSR